MAEMNRIPEAAKKAPQTTQEKNESEIDLVEPVLSAGREGEVYHCLRAAGRGGDRCAYLLLCHANVCYGNVEVVRAELQRRCDQPV